MGIVHQETPELAPRRAFSLLVFDLEQLPAQSSCQPNHTGAEHCQRSRLGNGRQAITVVIKRNRRIEHDIGVIIAGTRLDDRSDPDVAAAGAAAPARDCKERRLAAAGQAGELGQCSHPSARSGQAAAGVNRPPLVLLRAPDLDVEVQQVRVLLNVVGVDHHEAVLVNAVCAGEVPNLVLARQGVLGHAQPGFRGVTVRHFSVEVCGSATRCPCRPEGGWLSYVTHEAVDRELVGAGAIGVARTTIARRLREIVVDGSYAGRCYRCLRHD